MARPIVPYMPWTWAPPAQAMGAMADAAGLPNNPDPNGPALPLPLRMREVMRQNILRPDSNPWLAYQREQAPVEDPEADLVGLANAEQDAMMVAEANESSMPAPKAKGEAGFRQAVNRQAAKGDRGGQGAKQSFSKPMPAGDKAALDSGEYTINRGDTLSAIARRLGVSTQELARINSIKDPNFIRAGDKLRLRDQEPVEAAEAAAPDEGESPLAMKIREANARGNPSALEAVRNINYGNPFNQGIRDAAGTAGAFAANAASMPLMFMRMLQAAGRAPEAAGTLFRDNPFRRFINPENVTR